MALCATPAERGCRSSAPNDRLLWRNCAGERLVVAGRVVRLRTCPRGALLACDFEPTHHAIVLVLQKVAVGDHLAREGVDVEADRRKAGARREECVVPIPNMVIGIVEDRSDLVGVHVRMQGMVSDARDVPLLDLANGDLRQSRWLLVTPDVALAVDLDHHWVQLGQVDGVRVLLGHRHLRQVSQVARTPDREGFDLGVHRRCRGHRRLRDEGQHPVRGLLHCYG
mmetsp:Transcript_134636/g.430060  ORF Transcript_134636/g.430060 Transcript_134636/m.430060 type:complete len:225 (+) Transcript_134636:131-805(+)